MGFAILIAGLALFLAPHVFTAFRERREGVIASIGENAYKIVYSIISLAGLVLIFYGYSQYRATGWINVWNPPAWTRHVAVALVWPAIICFVATYSPGRIKTVLKHPTLVGLKLWALAHLLANGDLGSMVLFGALLAYAVFDRISLKHRTDPGAPPIPVGGVKNDVIAVVGGTVLYLLLGWWFHPYVIGVPAFTS
ncbi:MAG: NnrU family protein [Xanthobacteraceae bacterium]|jgi:uncharacterized membrane protein